MVATRDEKIAAAKPIVEQARQGNFSWETRKAIEWGTGDTGDYWDLREQYGEWQILEVAQWCRDHPDYVGSIVALPTGKLIRPGIFLTKVRPYRSPELYLESMDWYRQALIQDVLDAYGVMTDSADRDDLLHPDRTSESIRFSGLTASDFGLEPGQLMELLTWMISISHPEGVYDWPGSIARINSEIARRAYQIVDWSVPSTTS